MDIQRRYEYLYACDIAEQAGTGVTLKAAEMRELMDEITALRAENERLNATIHNKDVALEAYRVEVEQLQAALEKLTERVVSDEK